MSGLFSKPKAPSILPPPTMQSKEVEQAAEAEALLARRRKKKYGLIQTSPEGILTPPTTLTTRLGE